MKKLLGIIILGLLVVSCGKGKTVKMKCNSLKYGTMEWRYNNKNVQIAHFLLFLHKTNIAKARSAKPIHICIPVQNITPCVTL